MENLINEKLLLLVKPCQSGKTKNLMEGIKDADFEKEINRTLNFAAMAQTENGKNFHFIFCNNRLTETEQLCDRMKRNHIENFEILSSSSELKSWKDAYIEISTNGINKLVLCSNKTRIEDADILIGKFTHLKDPIESIYFWIDEGDANINTFEVYIRKWLENPNVKQIMLITATPKKFLLNDLLKDQIVRLDEPHGKGYLRLSQRDWSIIPRDNNNANDYAEKVFKIKENLKLIKPGTKWFIPSNRKNAHHQDLKDLLLQKNFAVLIMNQNGNVIYYKENGEIKTETIISKKNNENDEISKKIETFYKDLKLDRFAFAITGYNCISRGVTLQTKNFCFDFAILSEIYDSSEAYQMAGRLCGYLPREYFNCKIFATNEMKTKVLAMEELAINLNYQ